jgi:hypothetical protein
MKLNIFRFRLYTIIVIVCACMALTVGQKTIKAKPQSEYTSAPTYRIGSKYRPENNPSLLIIHIEVTQLKENVVEKGHESTQML